MDPPGADGHPRHGGPAARGHHGVSGAKLDRVFLTGGSAFVPAVRQLFARAIQGRKRSRGAAKSPRSRRALPLRAALKFALDTLADEPAARRAPRHRGRKGSRAAVGAARAGCPTSETPTNKLCPAPPSGR